MKGNAGKNNKRNVSFDTFSAVCTVRKLINRLSSDLNPIQTGLSLTSWVGGGDFGGPTLVTL